MTVPSTIAEFWSSYCAEVGGVDESRFYEAFYFGDSEKLANALAELVLSGVKRATAESVWAFEAAGKRIPRRGDLSVVTDWAGKPLCVIETTRVDVMPFCDVPAEFAAVEGEGDGSLGYWQRGHAAYFSRACAKNGRTFNESMLVTCERFDVIYPARSTKVAR